ncbi:uncharacterized protein BT62DRAFT_926376 [Guyanagaster necrorhizus]|uniref:RNA polymerase II subunit A C-terminal domain phosphatase n=1 Tax=Guyanagaster necrorhizus TaxID=856835 RepID=A0A9P7W6I6_9AGAR|nr:uncharacterized protein BT62DRAFT_926376 [Guyanagaster necrorhizus MCA 3950]KAG7452156.1 hypothetical protein BT62DRAFT_926376 [Guyanagaster necrorhizus MCA 3950]
MTEETPTEIFLPPSFPYPIKISSIDAPMSSTVQRGIRLLSYSFQSTPQGGRPETRFGTWDCAIDGDIKSWNVKAGDVITAMRAKDKPVVVIQEPCKHGMQLGGLCVLCGKDMTNSDYIGFSDTSRASIQMTHSANGPTVSLEEAQRIERETAERLIKSRKLSLIVDLDQTIVHATVDPTVGEWIAEGEAWEEKHKQKNGNDVQMGEESSDTDEEECNPNWEALKDVKKFKLGPESFGMPYEAKGKGKSIEQDGCMYYIKPRPGWQAFLLEVAAKYEMHVYTMGTRAYAEQVCAAIDPDGKLFGGRLLSRDESGSLTQKSLQRLFPCDTSMVVIIDDRGDVWEWSPNLIKVVPYDFFVGIGDINSAFLPKVTTSNLMPSSTQALITQNSIALEAQVEERPLARMQEQLTDSDDSAKDKEVSPKPDHEHTSHRKKALLKSQDNELERVAKLLDEVHQRFFDAYDASSSNKRKRGEDERDVTKIIPSIRCKVLQGVHIVFSSLFPMDTNPESSEVWKMARTFGAKCSAELVEGVTHVVAAKPGTDKVNHGSKRPGVRVVWAQWLTDCIMLWQRVDETPYLMDPGVDRESVLTHGVVVRDKDKHHHDVGVELEMGEINWNDINDEVDAAMNESDDDEDEDVQGEGYRVWDPDDESAPNTPRKRTRSRSVTPSKSVDGGSPESKKRKLESSTLKETVSATDLAEEEEEDEDEDGDEEEEIEVDEDFLAKELEEDWG